MINEEQMNKWTAAAWSLPDPVEKPSLPINILTGEAVDVLRFCQRNWESGIDRSGAQTRVGLKSAVGNGTFTEEIKTELAELLDAFQEAQNRYRLLVDSRSPNPMDRAQHILGEIRSTLSWLFDDGKADDADAQLAALDRAHVGAISQDDVAGALFEYAELARRHRERMEGLGGFDGSLIDESVAVGAALRERSAGPEMREQPAVGEARELRNRLGAMLLDRMQRVRAAARFVFRKHPDLVREVTSKYARTQRASQRSRGDEEEVDPPDVTAAAAVAGAPTA